MRRLRVTRRQIPLDHAEEYDAAWAGLRRAVELAGGKAWRYRSSERDDLFIEFTESSRERDDNAEADMTQRLERLGPGSSDTWTDATSPGAEPLKPDRVRLLELLRSRSLRRGEFVLSSGKRSSYYIDARTTTMSGLGQMLIGRVGLETIERRGWDARLVGGLTLGADPVAYAIAHAAAIRGRELDAFTVRKEAKAHGTGRRIEGSFTPELPTLVCEDVITTGESALQAIAAIQAANGKVTGVLALVDREEGGRQRIEAEGLPVEAIFTTTELLADS